MIERRWNGGLCIVAASGPSLTPDVAALCACQRVVAVNDAYRLLPDANVLYAADWRWWKMHHGAPEFHGERWTCLTSSHSREREHAITNYRLRAVQGKSDSRFSNDPAYINFGVLGTGAHSGFQAINLALLLGADLVALVGFDMRAVNGKRHFFGDHPKGLNLKQHFSGWINNLNAAAKRLPPNVTIINCTPGSALKCFPIGDLSEVINGSAIGHAA